MQGALELARGICHDLNQPLQVLLGYSEMLMAARDAEHPEYDSLAKMKKAAERIASSTTQLMNISRYETRDYLGGKKIMNISLSSNDQGEKERERDERAEDPHSGRREIGTCCGKGNAEKVR